MYQLVCFAAMCHGLETESGIWLVSAEGWFQECPGRGLDWRHRKYQGKGQPVASCRDFHSTPYFESGYFWDRKKPFHPLV